MDNDNGNNTVCGSGLRLKVLGSRGSVPVTDGKMRRFGGGTSCYMVSAGDQTIFLDAGTGLAGAPVYADRTPVILVSHLHLDHLLGLGMYPGLAKKGCAAKLFLPARSDEDALRLLNGLYGPPYWPLSLTEYAGELAVHALPERLEIGPVTVTCMQGHHPGGCAVMRLDAGRKSLVYATDCEPKAEDLPRLAAFCRDADLLMFDGQFTPKEAECRTGYGHSTAETGLELLRLSGAKRLLVIHHDPQADDAALEARERAIGRDDVRFARAGEEIVL